MPGRIAAPVGAGFCCAEPGETGGARPIIAELDGDSNPRTGWSAPTATVLRLPLPERQSPLSGYPAQSLVPARKRRPAPRALRNVVLRVVAEPARRHPAPGRLPLRRDHRIDPPALPDPRRARMVRKPLVQPAADEAADRASGDGRARCRAGTLSASGGQPSPDRSPDARRGRNGGRRHRRAASGIENPVDARKDVVVRNQLLKRPGNEQLQLGQRPALQHAVALPVPTTTSCSKNHGTRGFQQPHMLPFPTLSRHLFGPLR